MLVDQICLTVMSGCIVISLITLQFLPIILDVILPLNESRPCKPILVAEYFVSQDEYLYTIILHEIILALVCGSIITATGLQLLIFIYHSLGMFKIAR